MEVFQRGRPQRAKPGAAYRAPPAPQEGGVTVDLDMV